MTTDEGHTRAWWARLEGKLTALRWDGLWHAGVDEKTDKPYNNMVRFKDGPIRFDTIYALVRQDSKPVSTMYLVPKRMLVKEHELEIMIRSLGLNQYTEDGITYVSDPDQTCPTSTE